MPHKVCLYRLTNDGKIPDFIYSGSKGMHGIHIIKDYAYPSPCDSNMIGITINLNDNSLRYVIRVEDSRIKARGDFPEIVMGGEFNEFKSREELEGYLNSISNSCGNGDIRKLNLEETTIIDEILLEDDSTKISSEEEIGLLIMENNDTILSEDGFNSGVESNIIWNRLNELNYEYNLSTVNITLETDDSSSLIDETGFKVRQ